MTEEQDPRREQYDRARAAFEDLAIEDRVLFLVKETVSTIARGIQETGRVMAEEMDDLFRSPASEEKEDAPPEEAPAPAKKARSTSSRAKKSTTGTASKSGAKKTTRSTSARSSRSAKASDEESDTDETA